MANVKTLSLAVVLAAGVVALGACSKSSTGPLVPSLFTIVSGDSATATVSSALSAPLVVQVSDQNGNPLSGVPVSWSVISGSGTLSADSTTTDATGQASVTWTLGALVGAQSVEADIANFTPLTFTATATSP